MPRVKLGRDPKQVHNASVAKIIPHPMTERDIPSQTVLAQRTGIQRQTLGRRLRTGGWELDELMALDKVLRFSAEDAAAIIGVRG